MSTPSLAARPAAGPPAGPPVEPPLPLAHRHALLDRGELDPAGYRRRLAAHIAATEPRVHAFVDFDPASILDSQAPAVPTFTVKDTIDVAGLPTGLGLRVAPAAPAVPAGRSAFAVDRLQRLGWACLGKVTTTECALGTVKPSGNPRYPHVSPAGSSTGSAASVAAGYCDASLGSDSGGSLRWPAVYCGVVALRLSPRAELAEGVRAVAPSMESVGLIARTVADLAWLWHRYDLATQFGTGAAAGPGGEARDWRVAVSAPPDPLHPEVATLLDRVRHALGAPGWPVPAPALPEVWRCRADAAALLAREAHDSFAALAADPATVLGADTRAAIRHGAGIDDRRYRALRERQEQAAALLAALLTDRYDAVVQPLEQGLPDLVTGPPDHGGDRDAAATALPALDAGPVGVSLTLVANFARLPALALPLAGSSQRSPLGVQVIAAPGREEVLLAVGAQLEALAEAGRFAPERAPARAAPERAAGRSAADTSRREFQ